MQSAIKARTDLGTKQISTKHYMMNHGRSFFCWNECFLTCLIKFKKIKDMQSLLCIALVREVPSWLETENTFTSAIVQDLLELSNPTCAIVLSRSRK